MCSRARKRNGEEVRIGSEILIRTKDGEETRKWSGFARIETLKETWTSKYKTTIGELNLDSYWEKGVWFHIPENLRALGLLLLEDTPYHREGEILIITRPAEREVEKRVHHRHPVLMREDKLPF